MFIPLEYSWKENLWDRTVFDVCDSWAGTPYMLGQQVKGRAVDCVHFVAGVLSELFGEHRPIPTLRGDVAWHDREAAFSALYAMMEAFPSDTVEGTLEAGDVIWTGPHNGNPSHGLIVAGPQLAYHAPGKGHLVEATALGYDSQQHPGLKVLRPRGKDLW